MGSPPLVRERLFSRNMTDCCMRITPARAGKTRNQFRICRFPLGSPPLVRERLKQKQVAPTPSGITPARAGKTTSRWCFLMICGDHPRSCGKDRSRFNEGTFEPGSPPLVRERHELSASEQRSLRITPARAGKTGSKSGKSATTGDHPRSCGKDNSFRPFSQAMSGSPPLVRERLTPARAGKTVAGITPARAGKTARKLCGDEHAGDHPRSCGKDRPLRILTTRQVGSPPLVRERQ